MPDTVNPVTARGVPVSHFIFYSTIRLQEWFVWKQTESYLCIPGLLLPKSETWNFLVLVPLARELAKEVCKIKIYGIIVSGIIQKVTKHVVRRSLQW